ncbi:hypothetical protein CFP65_1383 [Kitasatospora sp. MMS16-BH015]|uniref:Crp/Fnr family transcriptional regulator n=1 Tax=Kitasatospora sp. MMS16-BH015 TaxID=2018025 RepID=UPI000CA2A9B9|nr:cyclic nucleotide-binding domain-containing protein [Kitasatospora sp. MMS16-BH015]AUG76282.1 hypothetical protein CFP65_1383 [Kitasatospora sp. MMS16-BH015]
MYESANGRSLAVPGPTLQEILQQSLWDSITADWRRRWVPAGERLILQGHPGTEVFGILKGALRVERMTDGASSVVAFRSSGDLVGEGPALNPKARRMAQVVAHTDCELVVGSADRFRQVLLGSRVGFLLNQYLYCRGQEMDELRGASDPELRLAVLIRPLVRNAWQAGGSHDGLVTLRVNRDHLAQGLYLGHHRARKLLNALSIGQFCSKGELEIDLRQWEACVARLGC